MSIWFRYFVNVWVFFPSNLNILFRFTNIIFFTCTHSVVYCASWVGVPSKHLLVFKTSWRSLQDMSWRRLQHVFNVTTLRLPRRLEDALNPPCQDVLKTSWRRFQDLSQDVFKTSWRHVLKTSWRHILICVFKTSRRQAKFLLVISVSNKSKCVSNKSLFHKLYLRNLRRIQNASLRTQ